MAYWERSTDSKQLRELTYNDKLWWSFVYYKGLGKVEITTQVLTRRKKTPPIPIADLLWLLNGNQTK